MARQQGASLLVVSILLLAMSLMIAVSLEQGLLEQKSVNAYERYLMVFNACEDELARQRLILSGQSISKEKTANINISVVQQRIGLHRVLLSVTGSGYQTKLTIKAEYIFKNEKM